MHRFALVGACSALALVVAAAPAGGGPTAAAQAIAYWSDSPFPSLWRVAPDGSGRKRIEGPRLNAKRPDVSPDGRLVAFDGARPGTPAMRDFNIQLVRLDGTGLRVLTRGSSALDVDAHWAPDGRALSFS